MYVYIILNFMANKAHIEHSEIHACAELSPSVNLVTKNNFINVCLVCIMHIANTGFKYL